MSYDEARGVAVLFGGDTGAVTPDGETWEWNGLAWAQRTAIGPSGRFEHAMSYDRARAVTVVFGGYVNGYDGETWEWDGIQWAHRVIAGPSPRRAHAMTYDVARRVSVLFGGGTYTGKSGETWELGVPCTAPTITASPTRTTAIESDLASFSVSATGGAPLNYRWRQDGANISDGGAFSGTTSPTLTINPVTVDLDAAAFDCVVSNTCGQQQSAPAGLAVHSSCPADFNGASGLDSQDFFDFLEAFFSGCP